MAPLALSVTVSPVQIRVLEAEATKIGFANTTTGTCALEVQPRELVPNTEYTVFTVGLTVILALVLEPGDQE